MARRATAIKQEREKNKGIVLLLDAGNTLFGRWLTQKSEGRALLEPMNAMGYDAMVIGQADLTLGLEVLKKRAEEAKFPFLSANLVNQSDKQLVFKPYVILERQGARIGILGLTDTAATKVGTASKTLTVLDPKQVAAQYVPELRGQVDLLIVLSRLGIEDDHALAKAVPGIDVIVGGNTRKIMEVPEREGNTIIVQQGYDGEWMGRLQATFDAKGVPSNISMQLIALTDEYADDPEMVALMSKWRAQYPSPTLPPTPVPNATRPPQPPVVPTAPPTKKP